MSTPETATLDILSILKQMGFAEIIVLLVLGSASVFSWAIILAKWRSFNKARDESEHFLDVFSNLKSLEEIFTETKNFSGSPVSNVFRAGYIEFQKVVARGQEKGASVASFANMGLENVQRALRKASIKESSRLEKLLSHLGTIASTSPYIGLFGTVWGIMTSFQALASGGPATIRNVAPGISGSLIATAAGLAAAIPAVIAYNHYAHRVKLFRSDMDNFSSDFINILKRTYLG